MRMNIEMVLLGMVSSVAVAQAAINDTLPRERIRIVHQDISKWDKNGDGRLTGAERDTFVAEKRKEAAAAAAAARAARANAPKSQGPRLPKPTLSAEDSGQPTPKGIPKSIDDATR